MLSRCVGFDPALSGIEYIYRHFKSLVQGTVEAHYYTNYNIGREQRQEGRIKRMETTEKAASVWTTTTKANSLGDEGNNMHNRRRYTPKNFAETHMPHAPPMNTIIDVGVSGVRTNT